MKPQPTVHETARKAMQLFHKNADTLIAGYLVRHPDTDPADVELVMQYTPGGLRFSIEPRELHVPSKKTVAGEDCDTSYVNGWNACRDEMIAQAKSARAPEAMVSTMEAVDG